MRHEQIESIMYAYDSERRAMIAVDQKNPHDANQHQAVTMPSALAGAHVSLVQAAPMLYQALTQQYLLLQQQIDAIERDTGRPELAKPLLQAQNAILMVQRFAQIGQDGLAKEYKIS